MVRTIVIDAGIGLGVAVAVAVVMIVAGVAIGRFLARRDRAPYRPGHAALRSPQTARPADVGSMTLEDEIAYRLANGLEPGAFYESELPPGAMPWWADPEADRVTQYGAVSGSAGSDYGGSNGVSLIPRPMGGPEGLGGTVNTSFAIHAQGACLAFSRCPWCDAGPGPAPLGPTDGTWADWTDRLLTELRDAPTCLDDSHSSPAVAGRTGKRAGDASTAPQGVIGPGWAPSRLGTPFDAELAAEVSEYMRRQDRECAEFAAGLLS